MRVVGLFDAFELNDDLVLDNEIRSEAFVEFEALVVYRNGNLSLDTQPLPSELMGKNYFINRLQQSRADLPVYLHCHVNNHSSNLVFSHSLPLPWRIWGLGEKSITVDLHRDVNGRSSGLFICYPLLFPWRTWRLGESLI